MTFTPRSDEEAAAAITRLVDGALGDAEKHEVEAWADSSPEVSRTVDRQRRVKHALADGGPPAPERLLDAIGGRVGRGHSQPEPRRRRWSLGIGRIGVVAVMAAAAAFAIVEVTGGSAGGAHPSITAAARLALEPAPAPAPRAASAHYLDVSYHGVTFPNYQRSMHAVATGKLTGAIGGRSALTVYYRLPTGGRMSYTVFSGAPVGVPPMAWLARRVAGVSLRAYRTGGISVVTLVRHGRTCVLAARAPVKMLVEMATEPVLVSSKSA